MFSPEGAAEAETKITREEVMEAYKKFNEKGIGNPDDLDLEDPEVQKANSLLEKWQAQADQDAEENEELARRNNLAKTMIYVDAGFTDPDYLDEVLEWLHNDLDELGEEDDDSEERTETRRLFMEAIKKIENLISKAQ